MASYVAGAVFLATTIGGAFLSGIGGPGPAERPGDLVLAVLLGGLVIGAVIAVFALVPAGAIIVWAEQEGRRSPRFFALAGAIVGPASFALFLTTIGQGFADANPSRLPTLLTASLTAGIAAALTYWALAGRNAGAPRRYRRYSSGSVVKNSG